MHYPKRHSETNLEIRLRIRCACEVALKRRARASDNRGQAVGAGKWGEEKR